MENMKTIKFAFITAVLALAPLSVFASTIEAGKSIYIPSNQTLSGNTYLAGGEVTVSSQAPKDLVASGGRVIVNAPVWGDALLAGGTVDILDTVAGDVRVAGGQVSISAPIGGDLIVLGGAVTVNSGAPVSGDVVVVGGSITLNASVAGSVRTYGGEVMIDASIKGPVIMQVANQVSFGPNTKLSGSLAYVAPKEAHVAEGADLGGSINFMRRDVPGAGDADEFAGVVLSTIGVIVLIKFVSLLLAALVVTLTFKNYSLELARNAYRSFWKSAGVGFMVLVVGPVAALMFAISLVGLYLSFIIWALYGFVLLVAGIYACIFTGSLLARLIRKEVRVSWKWTVLGTVVFTIISFIPVVGWIVVFLVFLASLGVVSMGVMHDAKMKMVGNDV